MSFLLDIMEVLAKLGDTAGVAPLEAGAQLESPRLDPSLRWMTRASSYALCHLLAKTSVGPRVDVEALRAIRYGYSERKHMIRFACARPQ